MQPNGQDPNQQNPVPPTQAQPLPYAVPEYLHLDPVTGQAKRSFKKPILIVIGVLVALGIIYGSWRVWWSFNSPEAKFYDALNNSLQVKFVTRKYTTTSTALKRVEDVRTDFTTMLQPKSSIDFSYAYKYQKGIESYAGEMIVMPPSVYEVRMNSATSESVSTSLGQWKSMDNSEVNSNNSWYIDGENDAGALNSVQGAVVLGNFTSNQRSQIMTYIRQHNIYTITSHVSRRQNGTNVIDYTVDITLGRLNDLNKKVMAIIGGSNILSIAQTIQSAGKFHIIVDMSQKRVIQTTYAVSGTLPSQNILDIGYPSSMSIQKPISSGGN